MFGLHTIYLFERLTSLPEHNADDKHGFPIKGLTLITENFKRDTEQKTYSSNTALDKKQ